jgi:hypothetical protein
MRSQKSELVGRWIIMAGKFGKRERTLQVPLKNSSYPPDRTASAARHRNTTLMIIVQSLPQRKGPQCWLFFSLLDSHQQPRGACGGDWRLTYRPGQNVTGMNICIGVEWNRHEHSALTYVQRSINLQLILYIGAQQSLWKSKNDCGQRYGTLTQRGSVRTLACELQRRRRRE